MSDILNHILTILEQESIPIKTLIEALSADGVKESIPSKDIIVSLSNFTETVLPRELRESFIELIKNAILYNDQLIKKEFESKRLSTSYTHYSEILTCESNNLIKENIISNYQKEDTNSLKYHVIRPRIPPSKFKFGFLNVETIVNPENKITILNKAGVPIDVVYKFSLHFTSGKKLTTTSQALTKEEKDVSNRKTSEVGEKTISNKEVDFSKVFGEIDSASLFSLIGMPYINDSMCRIIINNFDSTFVIDTNPFFLSFIEKYNTCYKNIRANNSLSLIDTKNFGYAYYDINKVYLVPEIFMQSSFQIDGDICNGLYYSKDDIVPIPKNIGHNTLRLNINGFPKNIDKRNLMLGKDGEINKFLDELARITGYTISRRDIENRRDGEISVSVNINFKEYQVTDDDYFSSRISKKLVIENNISSALRQIALNGIISPNSYRNNIKNLTKFGTECYIFVDKESTNNYLVSNATIYFNRSVFYTTDNDFNTDEIIIRNIEKRNSIKNNACSRMIESLQRNNGFIVINNYNYPNKYSNWIPTNIVKISVDATKNSQSFNGVSFAPYGFLQDIDSTEYTKNIYKSDFIFDEVNVTRVIEMSNNQDKIPNIRQVIVRSSNTPLFDLSMDQPLKIYKIDELHYNCLFKMSNQNFRLLDESNSMFISKESEIFDKKATSTTIYSNNNYICKIDKPSEILITKNHLIRYNLESINTSHPFTVSLTNYLNSKDTFIFSDVASIKLEESDEESDEESEESEVNTFKSQLEDVDWEDIDVDKLVLNVRSITPTPLSKALSTFSTNQDEWEEWEEWEQLEQQAPKNGITLTELYNLVSKGTIDSGNIPESFFYKIAKISKTNYENLDFKINSFILEDEELFNDKLSVMIIKTFFKSIQFPIRDSSDIVYDFEDHNTAKQELTNLFTSVMKKLNEFFQNFSTENSSENKFEQAISESSGIERMAFTRAYDCYKNNIGISEIKKSISNDFKIIDDELLSVIQFTKNQIDSNFITFISENLNPELFNILIKIIYPKFKIDTFDSYIKNFLKNFTLTNIIVSQNSTYEYNIISSVNDLDSKIIKMPLTGTNVFISILPIGLQKYNLDNETFSPYIHCLFSVSYPEFENIENVIRNCLNNEFIYYTKSEVSHVIEENSIVSLYSPIIKNGTQNSVMFFLPFYHNNGRLTIKKSNWSFNNCDFLLENKTVEVKYSVDSIALKEEKEIYTKLKDFLLQMNLRYTLGRKLENMTPTLIQSFCSSIMPVNLSYETVSEISSYVFTNDLKDTLSSEVILLEKMDKTRNYLQFFEEENYDHKCKIEIFPVSSTIVKYFIKNNIAVFQTNAEILCRSIKILKIKSFSEEDVNITMKNFLTYSDKFFDAIQIKPLQSDVETMIILNNNGIYTVLYDDLNLESMRTTLETEYNTSTFEQNKNVISNLDYKVYNKFKSEFESNKRKNNSTHSLLMATKNIRWDSVKVESYRFIRDDNIQWIKFSDNKEFMAIGFYFGVKIYMKTSNKYTFLNNIAHECVKTIIFGNSNFCITVQYDDANSEFGILWSITSGVRIAKRLNYRLIYYKASKGDLCIGKYSDSTGNLVSTAPGKLEGYEDSYIINGHSIKSFSTAFDYNQFFFSKDDKYMIGNYQKTFYIYDLVNLVYLDIDTKNIYAIESGSWVDNETFIGFTFNRETIKKMRIVVDIKTKTVAQYPISVVFPKYVTFKSAFTQITNDTHPLYTYLMNYRNRNQSVCKRGMWIYNVFVSYENENDLHFLVFTTTTKRIAKAEISTGPLDQSDEFVYQFIRNITNLMAFNHNDNYINSIYFYENDNYKLVFDINDCYLDESIEIQYDNNTYFGFQGDNIYIWSYIGKTTEITKIEMFSYDKFTISDNVIICLDNVLEFGLIEDQQIIFVKIDIKTGEVDNKILPKVSLSVDERFELQPEVYTEIVYEPYTINAVVPLNVDDDPISGSMCLNRYQTYTMKEHAKTKDKNVCVNGNLLYIVEENQIRIIPKSVQITKNIDGFTKSFYDSIIKDSPIYWQTNIKNLKDYLLKAKEIFSAGYNEAIPHRYTSSPEFRRRVSTASDFKTFNSRINSLVNDGIINEEEKEMIQIIYNYTGSISATFELNNAKESIWKYFSDHNSNLSQVIRQNINEFIKGGDPRDITNEGLKNILTFISINIFNFVTKNGETNNLNEVITDSIKHNIINNEEKKIINSISICLYNESNDKNKKIDAIYNILKNHIISKIKDCPTRLYVLYKNADDAIKFLLNTMQKVFGNVFFSFNTYKACSLINSIYRGDETKINLDYYQKIIERLPQTEITKIALFMLTIPSKNTLVTEILSPSLFIQRLKYISDDCSRFNIMLQKPLCESYISLERKKILELLLKFYKQYRAISTTTFSSEPDYLLSYNAKPYEKISYEEFKERKFKDYMEENYNIYIEEMTNTINNKKYGEDELLNSLVDVDINYNIENSEYLYMCQYTEFFVPCSIKSIYKTNHNSFDIITFNMTTLSNYIEACKYIFSNINRINDITNEMLQVITNEYLNDRGKSDKLVEMIQSDFDYFNNLDDVKSAFAIRVKKMFENRKVMTKESFFYRNRSKFNIYKPSLNHLKNLLNPNGNIYSPALFTQKYSEYDGDILTSSYNNYSVKIVSLLYIKFIEVMFKYITEGVNKDFFNKDSNYVNEILAAMKYDFSKQNLSFDNESRSKLVEIIMRVKNEFSIKYDIDTFSLDKICKLISEDIVFFSNNNILKTLQEVKQMLVDIGLIRFRKSKNTLNDEFDEYDQSDDEYDQSNNESEDEYEEEEEDYVNFNSDDFDIEIVKSKFKKYEAYFKNGRFVKDDTYTESYMTISNSLKEKMHKYRNGCSEENNVPVLSFVITFPSKLSIREKFLSNDKSESKLVMFDIEVPEYLQSFNRQNAIVKLSVNKIIDQIIYDSKLSYLNKFNELKDFLSSGKKFVSRAKIFSLVKPISNSLEDINVTTYEVNNNYIGLLNEISNYTFSQIDNNLFPFFKQINVNVDYVFDYLYDGIDFGSKKLSLSHVSKVLSEDSSLVLNEIKPIIENPFNYKTQHKIKDIVKFDDTDCIVTYGEFSLEKKPCGYINILKLNTLEVIPLEFNNKEYSNYINYSKITNLTISETGVSMTIIVDENKWTNSKCAKEEVSKVIDNFKTLDELVKKYFVSKKGFYVTDYTDCIVKNATTKIVGNNIICMYHYSSAKGTHGTLMEIYIKENDILNLTHSWNFEKFDICNFGFDDKKVIILGTYNVAKEKVIRIGEMYLNNNVGLPISITSFDKTFNIENITVSNIGNCEIKCGTTSYLYVNYSKTKIDTSFSNFFIIKNKSYMEKLFISDKITEMNVSKVNGYVSLYFESTNKSEIWNSNFERVETQMGKCTWM